MLQYIMCPTLDSGVLLALLNQEVKILDLLIVVAGAPTLVRQLGNVIYSRTEACDVVSKRVSLIFTGTNITFIEVKNQSNISIGYFCNVCFAQAGG